LRAQVEPLGRGRRAIDEGDDDVWSPSPAMAIESFQSALVGRCLVLSTLQQPA